MATIHQPQKTGVSDARVGRGTRGAVCACTHCSRWVAEIIAVGQEGHDGMLARPCCQLNFGQQSLALLPEHPEEIDRPIDEDERPVYSTD